jgi:hypothetical protein
MRKRCQQIRGPAAKGDDDARHLDVYGFAEMVIFVSILAVGLIYA